jgi:DNA replication protein DnaC
VLAQTSLAEDFCKEEFVEVQCRECGGNFTAQKIGIFTPNTCASCKEAFEKEKGEQDRLRNIKIAADNLSSRLKRLGIGERFEGMCFNDYRPSCDKAEKVLAACRGYVEAFHDKSGANVLMIGSPGTGKNMLAAIMAQEIIKRDFMCLHTTAMKLVRRVKESWRDKEESEQEVINSFVAPALLIIDEIGVQFGSSTEQLFLTEIINERYEKRRPTILISNLKLSQLTEVMGERVIDRFYDDGSKFLVFDWPSFRRK